jgi:hypothetical protein
MRSAEYIEVVVIGTIAVSMVLYVYLLSHLGTWALRKHGRARITSTLTRMTTRRHLDAGDRRADCGQANRTSRRVAST